VLDAQKVKTLEEALKKEQEARQTAEQEIKDAGVSLKTKSEEYTALEVLVFLFFYFLINELLLS
jgi:hypothetical protein